LGEKIFDIFLYLFMLFIIFITLYPFLNVIAISFNDSNDTIRGGVGIWPREPTIKNYTKLLEYNNILIGLRTSFLRTIIGTVLTVFCSSIVAYTISRADFILRKVTTVAFLLTMYISGGLIPTFMVIRLFGLNNNFWVYIIPNLVGAYYLILMRSFFQQLPFSLQESAFIDGANDLTVFFRIILPLSLPVIATIGLFAAVHQWNSWFDTRLFAFSNDNITTLQYELQKILQQANPTRPPGGTVIAESVSSVSPRSIRMAMIVVSAFPIIVVYPFVQKYFVTGMTLGAVKS
jgi:putative aldouronate transport system permease protein